MNLRHLTTLVVLLTATAAFAGPEHLIKQRAKDVRDQQNERQGAPPASPAAPPPSPTAPPSATRKPATPALSPQAAALAEAIGTIQEQETATDDQVRRLEQTLSAAARGSVKPSAGKIGKLAQDLAGAVGGTEPSPAKQVRMAQQLEQALNDSMTAGEMTSMTGEFQQHLRDAGAGRVPAAIVSNDLKSIIAEIQQGRSK